MSKVVFIVGALLTLLGVGKVGGLWMAEGAKPSFTALIPALAGLPIILFGVLALKEGMRAHAMHGVALIALVGFLLSAGRLGMQLATGGGGKMTVTISLAAMAALCGFLVFACVQTFRAARNRREAGAETSAE